MDTYEIRRLTTQVFNGVWWFWTQSWTLLFISSTHCSYIVLGTGWFQETLSIPHHKRKSA